MFFMAQNQYSFFAQNKIQKILTSSNEILDLGSLKTVHPVCAGYVLKTYNSLYFIKQL